MSATDSIWSNLTGDRLTVIAGPCSIESESLCLEVAKTVKFICDQVGAYFIFKSSFDKANRTSAKSFRGPGIARGLQTLARVSAELSVPVLTDIHTEQQAREAAEVVDILQIPALLCRQTDLIEAAAKTGAILNLKKGQFLSPYDMAYVCEKAKAFGAEKTILTERGSSFGYNNLVVDMRSIPIMQQFGWPVIFDATHSVQLPGAGLGESGGDSRFAPTLARAAVAAGAKGVFIETHPNPENALSDGPCMVPLKDMAALVSQLVRIKEALG